MPLKMEGKKKKERGLGEKRKKGGGRSRLGSVLLSLQPASPVSGGGKGRPKKEKKKKRILVPGYLSHARWEKKKKEKGGDLERKGEGKKGGLALGCS